MGGQGHPGRHEPIQLIIYEFQGAWALNSHFKKECVMAVYEGMFILDPGRYSRDPGTVSQQISDLIVQHGGTVLAARLWDERKLAYPIKGHKKGVYWLTYFTMPGESLTQLERQCEINDDILRKLVLRVDDRMADALVQHALSSGEAARRSATPAPQAAATATS
jgi:small subunit ribosomal protein S6